MHWRTIALITRDKKQERFACSNIRVVSRFLSDSECALLMNRTGVHICTSETEGFGHYLYEAKSTEALVVTTDAPPMNEHVNRDFGYGVPYSASLPQGMGKRFQIDPLRFEMQMDSIMSLGIAERRGKGRVARESYLAGACEFQSNLRSNLARVLER